LSDSATDKVVQPGSTIGIFGSGQLGKMMAVVAKQMGYRVHVFSPENDTPAGQVADLEIVSAYEDLDAVEKFAQGVDVITLEFENIPVAALAAAAKFVDVFPGNRALEIPQHRSKEKNFVRDNGISTCEFEIVRSLDELKQACMSIMPGVLKTVTGGYDGKGQFVIRSTEDIETAWAELKTDEAILEELIEFQYEFSVIGARSSNGRFAAFPAFRNDHRNQILESWGGRRTGHARAWSRRSFVRRVLLSGRRNSGQRNCATTTQLGTPHHRRAYDQSI
jgi:5-(carboxyamino)imidazole ribonucleotide synthase